MDVDRTAEIKNKKSQRLGLVDPSEGLDDWTRRLSCTIHYSLSNHYSHGRWRLIFIYEKYFLNKHGNMIIFTNKIQIFFLNHE